MSLSFTSTLSFQDFTRGYSIIMFAMWGLGVDIPRMIVRYGKAYPLSINIHSISMMIIGLLTLMYVVAEIVMYARQYGPSYDALTGTANSQYILSIILMCLVIVQFIFGFLLRVQMFNPSIKNSLSTMRSLHKILGYIVYILGKVVASLIVNQSVSSILFRAWIFFLIGLIFFLILYEIIYRSQTSIIIINKLLKHKNKHQRYHNQIYQNLLEKKQHFPTYKDKGVRYIIIDNNMYYIDEDFMHPGGQFIFNILNGKEVNYYLKGAKSITKDFSRHRHSKFVAKYLENRLIGEIGVDPLVSQRRMAGDTVDWKIVETLKTNYVGTYLVTFQTENGRVRNDLRVQQFGMYIMMGCMTEQTLEKTQRPYYLCHSLSNTQVDVLDNLRRYYKYYYFDKDIDEEANERRVSMFDGGQNSGRLSFFVKDVKHGEFTKFMLNAPKERIFSITGPYGRGLKLTPRSSGYYILIASDTGVAAYIDFLSFLLQKTLYDLIKRKASSPSLHKVNLNDTNFDSLSNVKVLFVGSFQNSAQFYLNTVIKELYYLNLKHGLKTFNMQLHYANNESEQEIKMVRDIAGKEFFMGLIEEEQPDRVYFSGNITMETALRKSEKEFKLKTEIEYI